MSDQPLDSFPEQSGKEIYVAEGQPLEAPVKVVEQGPLYKSITEVFPELNQDAEMPSMESSQLDSGPTLEVDRRDFMRLFSASALAATATACIQRPEEHAITYVDQPADQTVGLPVLYASTCGTCPSACGIIVKTREGRPRKIEGHNQHPISSGSTCALGQAGIQGLYHPDRRRMPVVATNLKSDEADWEDIYQSLAHVVSETNKIGIFTNGATGHRHKFFAEFLQKFGANPANIYSYEANALYASIGEAHRLTMGQSLIPRMDLSGVKNIVGIGTDFLNTGTHPVYSSKLFAASHGFDPEKPFAQSMFTLFEANYTATGSRADRRHVIAPGSESVIALGLLRELVAHPRSLGGGASAAAARAMISAHESLLDDLEKVLPEGGQKLKTLASSMLEEPSVFVAGSGDNFDENAVNLQILAVHINVLIGAYDRFLHISKGAMRTPVAADSLTRFKNDAPNLDVLFIIDTNPAFTLPESYGFAGLVKNIKTIVSMNALPNETEELAHYRLPNNHYLESWGDEEPAEGFWSIRQPVIRPITDSKQAEDVLMWIAATVEKPMGYKSYYDFLCKEWAAIHKTSREKGLKFDLFMKSVLRQGFYGALITSSRGVRNDVSSKVKIQGATSGLRLLSPLDTRLSDGRGADLPVLQEAGDALTTIAWDSWLGIHPETAKRMNLKIYDEVTVEAENGKSFKVGVYPIPGLHKDAVIVPRGNGRTSKLNRAAVGVGVNPLVAYGTEVVSLIDYPVTSNVGVKITKTGKRVRLGHLEKPTADLGNRTDIVKKLTRGEASASVEKKVDLDTVPDLYPKLPDGKYRWGMSIDLTKCSACSACMVACSLENNVPQVGRKLVLMGREMHWLRLDRYYEGPIDNPQVTVQPMMCQQCNHAPCEGVCPVFATTHDDEGLNTQTYNRCIGTRYCANACPYKARRFNWFTYKWNVPLNPKALNPDVTVRTRGIMEKCTFCIQRIRDAKHLHIGEAGGITDGELQTACQEVCPSDAIDFGNLLDTNSKVSRDRRDGRAYLALGGDPEHKHYGIKTLPNVNYLAQIVDQKFDSHHGGDHGKDAGHGSKHEEKGSEQHAPAEHGG